MKRNIAVVISVIVVLGALLGSSYQLNRPDSSSKGLALSPISLVPSDLKLKIPTLENISVSGQAWSVFQEYLAAAKVHDLNRLRKVSHQISATCNNPAMTVECNALMDGVYFLAKDWRQSDFMKVLFDDRQIVLATEFVKKGDQEPAQIAIFFTRDNTGSPKVLSIQLCAESSTGERCFEEDDLKRDADGNGWWDSVEALFYK